MRTHDDAIIESVQKTEIVGPTAKGKPMRRWLPYFGVITMQIPLLILVLLFAALSTPARTTDTPAMGNLRAGKPFRAECPTGSYLVGFSGRTGAWIDQIAPVCEPLLPDKRTFGKFKVGTMIGTSPGGTPDFSHCNNCTVIRVTRHSMTIGDKGEVKYVESIDSDCFTTAGKYSNQHTFGHPTEGVFKITPSKYLTGTHALYQLKWLNPPASQQGKGDFFTQEVPMSLIASPGGLDAPQILLAKGTWEIRVRINQPKVGDWSD